MNAVVTIFINSLRSYVERLLYIVKISLCEHIFADSLLSVYLWYDQ